MRIKDNEGIREKFEIRLLAQDWDAVRILARRNRITCSWITRLCLFPLLRSGFRDFPVEMRESLKEDYRQQANKQIHRHLLCLYGDDALAIRMFAAKAGISISMLVRIAIRVNVQRLAIGKVFSRKQLVLSGIKIFSEIIVPGFGMDFHPRFVKMLRFQKIDYW